MSENKEAQEKIQQLQLIEQNLQNFLVQKQSFQSQMLEVDSALNEIEKTDEAYKIVGNIMVASKKDELKKDLEAKKESTELRIKTIETQEEKLREKAEAMQKEVLESMKK
ncbi:prefoldin subunit beta [Candidatus Woesearchaeota archaeon]|jgi:prefoldin beta subunit|nr:prefoldin subunit beta [Candidatus Woesearchaeota archaeon]MBT3537972.1 prefoldin subunit beta [Candidatus Woesearchaeota archaeon]MBT4697327.1 prefoldin subunit beta [Candidatus Woesearchaeota archaeon]MBT4717047.1 prefoldin subunit beta [Candidatus Woesearchaeota archaeon]MBT7105641.1 prefoldin subunit beta [Candidatus Woesearchaeota archaeon]